ncbi:unnamed protein product [Trichobilharzia szidati]|nr:unnamed protein product [Trichobilharzia szidati]
MTGVPSPNRFENSDENNQPIIDIPSTQKDAELFSDSFTVTPHSRLQFTLRLINSEFEARGYKKILKSEAGQLEVIMSNFVNGVSRLIYSHSANLDNCKKIESSFQYVQSEFMRVQRLFHRCQQELDASVKLNELAKLKEEQMLSDKELLNDRLKTISDTLHRARLSYLENENKWEHQRRKLQIEIESLRKHLRICQRKASSEYNKRGEIYHSPTISTDLSTFQIRSPVEGDKVVASGCLSNINQLSIHDRSSTSPCSCSPGVVTTKASLTKQLSSSGSRRPWRNAVNIQTNRDNKSSLLIQQLQIRQNELCHENRELRYLVSQLSARIFQFSDYLKHNCDLCAPNNANISFNCDNEHHSLGESHEEHDISDFERVLIRKSIHEQSTRNIDVSLELPYSVFRDDLITRVQYALCVIWSKLKCLTRCHTNSVKETPGSNAPLRNTDNSPTVECVDSDKVHVENDDDIEQLENQLSQLNSLWANYEDPQS